MCLVNYRNDPYGAACLDLAARSKGTMAFGAVLVQGSKIIGRGWNRRSVATERAALTHVDYAIHAEQACVFDAWSKHAKLSHGTVYVLGYSNVPTTRGKLSVRDGPSFTCRKCPHTFQRYGLTVCVPTPHGWVEMTADEALRSAEEHVGYWSTFVRS